jgi:hypothetical protein
VPAAAAKLIRTELGNGPRCGTHPSSVTTILVVDGETVTVLLVGS